MEQEDNKLTEERREKLKALRAKGNAFPNDFRRKDFANDLHHEWGQRSKEDLEGQKPPATVAGRMVLKRVMGKASFATLQDGTGRIQNYVSQEVANYEDFKHWDLGDIVGVQGRVFKTMKGELTVHAEKIVLLVKALRPLPEKFHGLADQEMRYRQRYVDLIVTPESRRVFALRSKVIQALREAMNADGYLEVETPMMQAIPGGAVARPFKTHHHALGMDMYLRIAPELFLKRLVVGGVERVYEVNRNFRNEGISTRHNPEFTMMEWYCAYEDCEYMIGHTELVRHAAQAARATGDLPGQDARLRQGRAAADQADPAPRRRRLPTADLRDRVPCWRSMRSASSTSHIRAGIAAIDGVQAIAERHLVDPTVSRRGLRFRCNDRDPESRTASSCSSTPRRSPTDSPS
jgi:lysyl-tRNA synthetase class 2